MPPNVSDKQPLLHQQISWVWFAALGAFLLACGGMASSLTGGFIFDDIPLIQGNSRVHSFDHVWDLLRGNLWDTSYATESNERTRGFWRPVVQLSYALNWVIGDGDPFWFHLTNLIVHGLNAALLLFALRRWGGGDVGATLGALLFAVHPVQTETVAWIAGRTDSLCCFGLLLASVGFSRRLKSLPGSRIVEILGLIVALGSKESFILLPVFLALEVWAHEQRPPLSKELLVRYLRLVFPHLILVAAYLLYHQLFVRVEPMKVGVTWQNRVPLFLEAWGRYTALLIWPNDLTLGRALFKFRDGAIAPSWPFVALGAATLAVLGWAVLTWRRVNPARVAAWCYATMILPVSGMVWLDYDVLVSPRFLYIPMVAVCLLLAAGLAQAQLWTRSGVRLALAVALLALTAKSFLRARDFSSAQRFWRAEISNNPRYTAAWSFFVVRELKEGRPRRGLGLAHTAFATLSGKDDVELSRTGLIVPTLNAILASTPDLDRATFEQVAQFAHAIRSSKDSELRLPRIGLVLRIRQGSQLATTLRGSHQQLAVLEATARARLDQPERTAALLATVIDECPRCWPLFNAALPVLARIDRLDIAQRMLEQSAKSAPSNVLSNMRDFLGTANALKVSVTETGGSVRARVGYLSFVGAYGPAYQLARAEYRRQPHPALKPRVAELAALAGDERYAKQQFAEEMGKARAASHIKHLKLMAGLADQPVPANHWTPNPEPEP